MTKTLATIMYASILSRDEVRIALMITALNNHDILLGDILNVYVHAPITVKMWTTLDPISPAKVLVRL